MGRYVFNLPDVGEGIAEAEIVEWHVKVGDRIEEDGRIADMMTDKATVEMESPVSGTVIEVAGEAGDIVAIGSPLVVIEVEGKGNAEDAGGPPQDISTDIAAAPAQGLAWRRSLTATAVSLACTAGTCTCLPFPASWSAASPATRRCAEAMREGTEGERSRRPVRSRDGGEGDGFH